ncbi:glycoside hydrolase family 30 protein [Mucilaginibacter sp. OK098]|uniref:glycoside hydrolase family 30 protein n=1 Tax=Mucilaginibacter sp. OK098 TaxID=1855297 RepID=UPI0009156503|nr:glycoside hydrolase family 30 beta sandwich domain-containing protein [Mucilaginibacter sp. OK098]SHN25089.1 glucosylceramidase [Mucilaginibacter sp. OK098]
MEKIRKYTLMVTIAGLLAFGFGCSKKSPIGGGETPPPIKPVTPVKTDVSMWVTTADQFQLLNKQNVSLIFSAGSNQNTTINVDTTQTYQTIDGFGFCLSGGSAYLINSLSDAKKTALLRELFATDSTSIGISYIRITIGASDMSAGTFSYDDVAGDVSLQNFSLAKEQTDLIPILQKIIAINPNIKILACPWSAPAWMKDSNSFTGGSLKPAYFDAYANYFVKYIQGMKAAGITIDAITPQNEPLNAYNTPAMLMLSADEGSFIKNNLGPAFKTAGITTKIIVYDHNADHPEYATQILADAAANPSVDGSAFHLYGGSINALSPVHDAYPAKNIYFTEQATFQSDRFGSALAWHISNLIVGATRNWSRNVLEWVLATDANNGPHTAGGCSTCLGAVTISPEITRNVAYYIIAHASKFVRPGAVRIASDQQNTLLNVAFKNTDGSKVLIVINTSTGDQSFNLKFNSKIVTTTLPGGAVATYKW